MHLYGRNYLDDVFPKRVKFFVVRAIPLSFVFEKIGSEIVVHPTMRDTSIIRWHY